MKILHIIASVNPEGGGPVEYAQVMARNHAKNGHESSFVTLDRPNEGWISDYEFDLYACGGASSFFGKKRAYEQAVAKLAGSFDVAVIHGLWNAATIAGYTGLNRANVPWVIFTHGMLDPYFRKIKPVKHLIKQVFWTIWQGRLLSGAHAVLFTCEEEKLLAKRAFMGHQTYKPKTVAFCAADLNSVSETYTTGVKKFHQYVPKLAQRPYLLFLSRIHPKKACDNLIRAFAQIAKKEAGVDLVFAGPDQVGWQAELEDLAKSLGVAERIHWVGMIVGPEKVAAFSGATAFVLPSHQENFGIVVAEALSVGTPVLISRKVNIWREIIEDGAGIACEDTVQDTTRMLSDFLNLPARARTQMSAQTRACYEQRFSVEAAARDLEAVLKETLATPKRQ
ncbi:glycosyltransferase [Celeribacter baekdonensis]|uniref:glycosyltransferase n=1 Tax=Celeribacter baekdonensis TaxID=875171 RepID=UPI0026F2A3FE|nr:glycosyltransferase [Celeribacter baekdonensis]|tara:strand:- start:13635 stop:14816 length:1182 start_codon:yes stop_codon:yes gene_type:complete